MLPLLYGLLDFSLKEAMEVMPMVADFFLHTKCGGVYSMFHTSRMMCVATGVCHAVSAWRIGVVMDGE